MRFKQLNYIIEIADSQTISKAAEKLFLSRPALNHFLLDLEAELGTPLFKRIGKKLIPTAAGKVYLDSARRMLSIQKETYKTLADFANASTGSISIGITRGIGNTMFCEVFPKFHELYPQYTIELLEGNVRELETAMFEGKIDFCVVGSGSIHSGLEHIRSSPCEVVLVLPPDHPLGKLAAPPGEPYASIDLRLLKDEYFVLMNSDTNIRAIADKHFNIAGYSPKVMVECSLSTLAYSLVRKGIGPSILMSNQIKPAHGVHCFSLSPKEIWYQSVAFREGTHFSRAEQCFIDLALEFFESTFPSQPIGIGKKWNQDLIDQQKLGESKEIARRIVSSGD